MTVPLGWPEISTASIQMYNQGRHWRWCIYDVLVGFMDRGHHVGTQISLPTQSLHSAKCFSQGSMHSWPCDHPGAATLSPGMQREG